MLFISLSWQPAQAQFSALLKPQPSEPTASEATSYATLADLLEDEAARQQLIDQLRTLSAGQADGTATGPAASAAPQPAPEPAVPDPAADTPDLGERISEETQSFVDGMREGAVNAFEVVQALLRGEADEVMHLAGWSGRFLLLLLVGLTTLISFGVLRAMAAYVYRRMDRWVVRYRARVLASDAATQAAGPPEAADLVGPPHIRPPALATQIALLSGWLAALLGGVVGDVVLVLVSAAAGYAVALLAAGESGVPSDFGLLFVNAFVSVEIGRTLVRLIFATRYPNLRLLPMGDAHARYWSRWLERITLVTGYGLLLAIPIITDIFSPALARLFGLLIMVGVYVYAVRTIWKNRLRVRMRLLRRARRASAIMFGALLRMLAHTWHLLAIFYFTVLLIVSQVDPASALPFMAYASLQSALAVGVGLLLSALLTGLLSRRIRLSQDVTQRLPMLEARLNSYVPTALKGARLLILIAVVLFVFDAWQVFDLSAWLASPGGQNMVATLIRVAIILACAALAWTVMASVIEHRLSVDTEKGGAPSARERTLLSLFRNALLVLVVTMTILVVLSQIGIDIGPLIAGAGVVGLAIGFGAQKLVQDVINGIFIQLENGMNQNDVVEAGGVFGTVEKISIRSVGIRTLDGGYHMIPFSSVEKVTNHMRDFSYHLGEYTIAYRESVDEAAYHLKQAFDELMTDPVLGPEILEDMTIAGVTSLNERGFTLRILIKTKPGMQWAVQRGYNRLVKEHFNAAGIELPYPHTVVYFGQDKNGFAPPASVHQAPGREQVDGTAVPAGYTPRPLHARRKEGGGSDVLGNEMATVVNEEGEVTNQAGTTAGRDAAEESAQRDGEAPRKA